MLVLCRQENESIRIGKDVRVKVVSVHGGKVRLGIEAPGDVNVVRCEIDDGRDDAGESAH